MRTFQINTTIACLCYVREMHTGENPVAYIWMSDERGIVQANKAETPIRHTSLPPQVQDALKAHFKAVFDLPVSERGAYLAKINSFEVEVPA